MIIRICASRWSLTQKLCSFKAWQLLFVPPGLTLHSVRRVHLCLLYISQNKQQLFPCTTLNDCFLLLKRSVFTARCDLHFYVPCRVDLRNPSKCGMSWIFGAESNRLKLPSRKNLRSPSTQVGQLTPFRFKYFMHPRPVPRGYVDTLKFCYLLN